MNPEIKGKTKQIYVTEEVWKALTIMKAEEGLRSINDVLRMLLNIDASDVRIGEEPLRSEPV